MDTQDPGSPGTNRPLPPPPWMPAPLDGGSVPGPANEGAGGPPLTPLGPGAQEPARRPSRRGHRVLAIALATMLVVGGGGAATAFLLIRGASEEILQLVPASSDVVVTAYLDPSGGQKVNLMALSDRFPALRDHGRVQSEVNRVLDEALMDSGLTHDDVLPWLGSQVALAVDLDLEPASQKVTTTAFIVSTDDDAAETALETGLSPLGVEETREHAGVTVHVFGSDPESMSYALIGDVVVLSDHPSAVERAIDAAGGTTPAMAGDPEFLNAISSLPPGRLALAYVDFAHIVDEALSASGLSAIETAPQLGMLRAMRGMGVALSAHPEGLALDVALRLDPSELDEASYAQLDVSVHENEMLSFVPADSFVVGAQQGLDVSLRQMMEQVLATPEGERLREQLAVDDALDGLTGDMAFEVGPGTGAMPVGLAVLLGVDDPAAAQRTLDGLAELLVARERTSDEAYLSESGLSRRQQRELGLWRPARSEWRTSTYHGISIRYLDDPSLSNMFLPAYAVVEGAVVVASSPAEVRRIIDTANGARSNITTSSTYTRALARVPSGTSSFYVDASAVIAMLAPTLPPDVVPNLEPLKTLVGGSSSSPNLITQRIFLEIG